MLTNSVVQVDHHMKLNMADKLCMLLALCWHSNYTTVIYIGAIVVIFGNR